MTEHKLLSPCPFCGEKLFLDIDEGGGVAILHSLKEKDCFFPSILEIEMPVGTTLEQMIEKINRRAHDIGYRDLERKVKALEAECSILNRELLILSVELARRDEIIARLKEDAERLATRAVYWDDYGKEYECIHLECSGHSENILFDHAPDCPITLHRALMKELE